MRTKHSVPSSLSSGRRDEILARIRTSGGDYVHMVQVARLALQIFDELQPLHEEGAKSREILEAAAMLHDIGFAINEDRHHKHSRDWIVRNPIAGLTDEEIKAVACVARYHRRAVPSKRHSLYAKLNPALRRTVRHLAAILRVADGLDRSHRSNIDRVQCEVTETTIIMKLTAMGDVGENLLGAEKKKDYFEELFHHTLEFEIEKIV